MTTVSTSDSAAAPTGGPPPSPADVLAAVIEVLAVVCGQPQGAITPDTELGSIGADSLARVELAEQVEQRLAVHLPGLHIPDADLESFRTVGDACDYLVARL
jgi:acyl carrier protein